MVLLVNNSTVTEEAMPSKSKEQAKTMAAAAADPKFAKQAGIPPAVAKEFVEADRKRGTKGLPERKGRG